MNSRKFAALLKELCACRDGRTWAHGKSLQEVWDTCERGDWLLWLCGNMSEREGWPTRKQVVLAAVECATTALKYVKAGENRPAECLRIVREWCAGNATIEQVREARNDAAAAAAYYAAVVADVDADVAYYAAAAADAAYYADGDAAYYAAAVAAAAAAADYAAYYAAVVAAAAAAADYAAAAAAADYAAVARSKSLKESADKVREVLTPHIAALEKSKEAVSA